MDSSTLLFNQLKAAEPFFLLAGPNVIESEEHILYMAKHIKSIASKLGLPLVFKSSFDKANRTSSKSFRGPGLAEGLKILEKVKATYDIPIVTDVHEAMQCEAVGKVADIIQIPAFLCRQTDLLVAAAKTGKIINIKKGQFCAPSVMVNSAEKIRLAGNENVMVCERGTMFGYNDLIVDPRNLEWLREANSPVVADITHSLQQPAGRKLEGGGVASGGLRELIPCIARTAVAVGVDGIFMEVHDDPLKAPVDGPTQWPLRHLEELLEELIAIAFGRILKDRVHCENPKRKVSGVRNLKKTYPLIAIVEGVWLKKDMVAVKGRLNSLRDRTADDPKMSKRGEVKNLKIYVEDDKLKNPDTLNNRTKRQSATLKTGGYLQNANDSKSGVKKLEKGKSKPDKSMSSKVGRKVLADIGNRNCSFSKTELGTSSRPGKGKSGMMLFSQRKGQGEMMLLQERGAVDLVNTEGSSSGTLSTENVTLNLIQDTHNNQTSKKFVKENIKTTSDEPRMKVQSRNSITTTFTGRKSVRNPLLTRKSLPVLKQASRLETSGTGKENSEKSSNFRRKHGFPVNPSARGSIAPKPSNPNRRPWGNRVSDGFVVMTSRAETKVDAGVRSRKSIKPTVQRSITALSTRRNSKSSHTITTKKVTSRPADLSKTKEDKVSVSKNIPSVVAQDEPAREEDISSGTVQRKKIDRRNSFTSSLVSRSKLLKECTKVTSRETLPEIYDRRNHLEVCDYVDDIYQYYWVMEGQNPLLKSYLETQKDITPHMRGILINWLIEVHQKFDLMEETLFLTVTLLDRYLSLELIKKSEIQLVGLTALLLASKYEDFWHPRVTDLISISAESYTRDQMLKMEKTILKKLKFRLNQPTPYVFMLRFLKAAQSDKKFERLAFYLIELCLVEHEALNYKPSMLCASAIYVARCTMRLTPRWTPLLTKHARYEESEIRFVLLDIAYTGNFASYIFSKDIEFSRSCAEMILKFHKAAKTSLLRVTCEKYANVDLSRVATIKPLERLP
ncbi:Aldolase-type TIM barrel family protein [Perilla frutescens var. hirtella]|uniref:3-deoxy-8-phosphooctulonate synthase n=2 Tax=Magnoliopsida TaxID=3398 RepID=A0AAD4JMS1_PERFH|nr:Aldolase-type TIM barrel family protein [Perilla frutescens var. hirtella]